VTPGISLLINCEKEEDEEEDELGDEVFALMDFDGDGQVTKAEFMLYKLVRMGLVKPEHLKNCSEQFARLDFDGNGYLSQEDVEAFNEVMLKKKRKKRRKKRGEGRSRGSRVSGSSSSPLSPSSSRPD
jgi:Ca2+-binding EF-hand superfamily protein